MTQDKSALERLEDKLKSLWRESGSASVIAARHSEFIVEPKVFIGNDLNPEILKVLILHTLMNSSAQDSGLGHIEEAPDKLVIKAKDGSDLVVVRDKKLIRKYKNAKR